MDLRRAGWWDAFQTVALATILMAVLYQLTTNTQQEALLHKLAAQTKELSEQCAELKQGLANAQSVQPAQSLGAGLSLAAPASSDVTRKLNLYIGEGMVMCFVEPLGVHMVLEGTDKGMTPHLCRGLGWEPEISSILKRLARPGYHVLDVGANVGYYSIMFSHAIGQQGRLISVEANPRTYQLVQRTLEFLGILSNNAQLLHKAAFSKDDQKVRMTAATDRPLNNRISTDAENKVSGSSEATSVEVSTITVDTAVAQWQRLDLIKIDVEGAEAQVYEGMKQTIRRFPKVVIVMEVNTFRMGAATAKPFYEAMQRDFPQLRRIVGSTIQNTNVAELMANLVSDDLLVLSKGPVNM